METRLLSFTSLMKKASTPRPIRQLEGFKRINLKPGESKNVEFVLEARQFSIINNKEKRVIEPGYFTISVEGNNQDSKVISILCQRRC